MKSDLARAYDALARTRGISSHARITRHGAYFGQPSSRERLAELIGRSPQKWERTAFKRLRAALGRDPSLEELEAYQARIDRMRAKKKGSYA